MDLNFSIHSGSDPEVHKKITWKGRLGQFKPAVFFFFKLVFFSPFHLLITHSMHTLWNLFARGLFILMSRALVANIYLYFSVHCWHSF